jgi:hypothetical protein
MKVNVGLTQTLLDAVGVDYNLKTGAVSAKDFSDCKLILQWSNGHQNQGIAQVECSLDGKTWYPLVYVFYTINSKKGNYTFDLSGLQYEHLRLTYQANSGKVNLLVTNTGRQLTKQSLTGAITNPKEVPSQELQVIEKIVEVPVEVIKVVEREVEKPVYIETEKEKLVYLNNTDPNKLLIIALGIETALLVLALVGGL